MFIMYFVYGLLLQGAKVFCIMQIQMVEYCHYNNQWGWGDLCMCNTGCASHNTSECGFSILDGQNVSQSISSIAPVIFA